MKKIKNILIILFILLSLDFLASYFFFKKKEFWNYHKLVDHFWRIPSEIYHHDIMPNIDVLEPWGFRMEKRLITNSLGFRDFSNKKFQKISKKKRILLIGDSAIEGAGYDYKFTIGGLLQNEFSETHEILNSAVGSYSPSIYYKKINHFINLGYKFDKALIFLDPSDIIDELFIQWDDKENIKINKDDIKKVTFSDFLVNNFLIFRSALRVSDGTENLKNFLKLRYKTSKKYKKGFFKTTNEDIFFYRMTHVDRSAWTFDKKIFRNYEDGLKKSEKYLNKLINLLRNNNIDIDFILYPHPSQIVYEDIHHKPYWEKWAKENSINLISLYEDFDGKNKREITLKTFIYGDLHWNKKGTEIVFNSLIKQINF